MKPSSNAQIRTGANGGTIKAWTKDVPIDKQALLQIDQIAAMPFIHRHIAIMPDAHWGMGATIGSVIATKGAVIPAAVGVDLGCGMMARKTNLTAEQLPENLQALRKRIEKAVPHGRSHNGGPNDRGAWQDVSAIDSSAFTTLKPELDRIVEKHPIIARAASRSVFHLGTLGTGNHFIEICLDQDDAVWVMLHSGSRGIGNRIGTYFIELAKRDMKKWFIDLPNRDLSYFAKDTEHFDDYFEAVNWAQRFAAANRDAMMKATLRALKKEVRALTHTTAMAVNCHHNYISRERHFGSDVIVTRKGALSASKDELGIIPGSMGTRSFIVRGRGNPESFCSCSHGAGRVMSRSEARKTITLKAHAQATAGVECRKDSDVLDESPAAYKDIDAVMAAQTDLVEVVHELRQLVCVKG